MTPFQFHLREIASTGGARQQPRMVAKPRLLGWQITPCLDSFPNFVILTLTLSGMNGRRKNPCIVAPTDSAESFSALIAEAKCRDSFAFAQDRFFAPKTWRSE